MRFIYIFSAVTAVILTMLIVGLIVLSVQSGGGVNILVPGLGLVIWMPLVIGLLVVVDAAVILLSLFCRAQSRKK